jgi:hypothetical protein
MGALVPSPYDMEAINALNSVFSMPRLGGLRIWIAAHDTDFFVLGRHLHRIAYRVKAHPSSSSGNNPRGRWFKFLKQNLRERPGGAHTQTNHDIILTALGGFVGDPQCDGIHFWARYGVTSPTELPAGIQYRAIATQEAPDSDPASPTHNHYWGSITLLCRSDMGNIGADPDPTTANGENDPGEHGPEQPPI